MLKIGIIKSEKRHDFSESSTYCWKLLFKILVVFIYVICQFDHRELNDRVRAKNLNIINLKTPL